MLVKINKKDLHAVEYSCALGDCLLSQFTMETNDNMLQVEILNLDGSDLRPAHAWNLARFLEVKIQQIELSERP